MIHIKTWVDMEPDDIRISCADAGDYCPVDMPCGKCPFSKNSQSLDEILIEYLNLLLSEVNKHDD